MIRQVSAVASPAMTEPRYMVVVVAYTRQLHAGERIPGYGWRSLCGRMAKAPAGQMPLELINCRACNAALDRIEEVQ